MENEAQYIDASVILRAVYRQSGPSAFDDRRAIIVSSELTRVEVALAFQRRLLLGDINQATADRFRTEADTLFSMVRLFAVADEMLAEAQRPFSFPVGLRTAMQVATAQVISLDSPRLAFWTWVEQDAAAAASRGLATRGFERKA